MAPTASPPCPKHDLSVFPEALKGKKVLLCTESFGPVNGVSRTTLMLVNHLRANGCDLAVVSPHNSTKVNTFIPKFTATAPPTSSNGGTGTTAAASKDIEVRLHGYPVPFNPELSIAYLVRLSELYRRTFGCPPDLIYLASPASLGFQVMLQLRQRHRRDQVPVICNFQTDLAGYCKTLFPWPMGDIADYTFAAVQSFLFRHASVRTIFYPSTYVRRYLERHRVQGDKMESLTRGVDADMFHPEKRSELLRESIAPNGEIILICVARLAAEKSFDFLALVAQELDARGLDFKLYIVGGNRQVEVEAEIKDLFSDLVRKGKVIFAGFKVGEALAESYASADVFLHCSVSETFGLVVLESFASGVPVVARDMGGPSDTVSDGVSGFLTPPDDLSAFVDRVVLLANDRELRDRFRESALKQAREATWDKINNKVAWKMVDTIQQREVDLAEMRMDDRDVEQSPSISAAPVFGWLMLSDAVRETVVGSKLAAALGVIMGFWGLVGVYLVFTKATRWVKSLFSRP
ncbi:glycosyltransferase family 4 protein [Diaporthe amygdali]|uniref:glycosyltransferase family 4 protein n=1 Tax=Phomopsis amygdali TaxID=1214568 RepID=UPI0022FE0902|nr:glycosyltransferase family 4 protein [Diaporthe amygdali]KAJ0109019.1 glycosyltransferase family 4 protein [Diaporthe amygdali]